MTAITIQGPPLALDPATRSTLLQSVVDSLPIIPTASEAERTAQCEAAFALLEKLAPTDPVEAMLAFQIVAAQNACVNAHRCAARPDLPRAMHLSYLAKAATLSRLTSSKRRELERHQASQPALPKGFDAARELQARAAARAASAQPTTPAPQPAAPAQAAAPPVRAAGPDHAAIDQRLAKAAAVSHPADADDDEAPPTDAEFAQLVAKAHAQLAEITPAPADMGERLQAEIAARAAAATKLAA